MRGLRRLSRATVTTVALALAGAGCNQAIPTFSDLAPNAPAGADAGAAHWRMIVLSGPGDFPVAAPAPATSDAYRAELAAIKAAQGALTDAQRGSIEYWSGGGVMRWNEIMRELVAKADLPPAPRNGTYPAPDPENPFADPRFPFGNPPYAARAYSYVSRRAVRGPQGRLVLQAPVQPAVAVEGRQRRAGAHADHGPARLSLRRRGPLRRDRRAAQAPVPHLRGGDHAARPPSSGRRRCSSGKASASDIAAGLALGQAIAAVFVARAGADGMRTAGGSPAHWQALADAATARGEIPWRSMETPPRPPMLPAFGKVRAWMMTPTDIVQRAAGSAAFHLVRADGSRSSPRSRAPSTTSVARAARHRLQVGRRREHADAAGALELHRGAVCRERRVQRSARRPRLRAAEHGDARCRRGVLGHEVHVLQPAAVPARSGASRP